MKKHWLDKPILRDLFWFIVLPHRLKMFVAARDGKTAHNVEVSGNE